jgi:methylase of polypeptide subunit release factors
MSHSAQPNATRQADGVPIWLAKTAPVSADSLANHARLIWACPACRAPLTIDHLVTDASPGSAAVPPAVSDPGGRDGRAPGKISPPRPSEGRAGLDDDVAVCRGCGRLFPKRGGIWRFLLPDREAAHRDFIRQYQQVRSAEEWGSQDPAYYRSLPDVDPRDRWAEVWKVRKASFRVFLQRVILPLERSARSDLVVLDLGAGNGWLSNRLASRGHTVVAVDLSIDERDGLAATEQYRDGASRDSTGRLIPVQADFDHLPFQAGQADVIVFNGSFHYSLRYETTLQEARRILRPCGVVAVLDTPFYSTAAQGAAMLRERDDRFRASYGLTIQSVPAEGFLDDDRWQSLRETSGMEWQKLLGIDPIRRMVRRSMTRIKGKREPATFPVFVGRQLADGDPSPPERRTKAKFTAGLARARLRLEFRLLLCHRLDRVVTESVAGRRLVVYPSVFNPVLFRSGRFLGETLSAVLVPPGSDVLDLGTGSGAGAIVASEWARRVIAVDVNPEAARCARFNAERLGLGARIDVRHGDLFEPVADDTFDVILFNPPYYRGAPRDAFDQAWHSTDVVERFAAQLGAHLNRHGWALVLLSTDGESADFVRTFVRRGWQIHQVARRHYVNESFTLYRLTRASEGLDDRSL